MHACIYVDIYIYVYVCSYTHVYTYIYIYTHAHLPPLHIHIYLHKYCICACFLCIYLYLCIYVQMYIYIYIPTYIYAARLLRSGLCRPISPLPPSMTSKRSEFQVTGRESTFLSGLASGRDGDAGFRRCRSTKQTNNVAGWNIMLYNATSILDIVI